MSAQCFNDDLRSVHKFLDNLFLSFNKNISLNDSPQDFYAKLKENFLFLKYKSKNLCKF